METTYLKNGNLYEVRLTVFLAYVEYVGNGNYPFCCNIFTTDDKHFRCAVKPGDVAELFLLQRGDNLVLQLVPVVEASLVMGLASFRNLSQKRINLGEQKTPLHAWEFFSTALTVQEVCALPMPYALTGAAITMQDAYYCVIKDLQNGFIGFSATSRFLYEILGSRCGDFVNIVLHGHDWLDGFLVLQNYINTSRKTDGINEAVRNL